MCDVTNKNFHQIYSEIVSKISSSHFISIDCEFSGLSKNKDWKASLFDNPSESYEKNRRRIEDFIVFQIGITCFTYIKENNQYEALTYTFHLFPRLYSGKDCVFLCDASSISFLCSQYFDFNKVFNDGITYSRISEEDELKNSIADGSIMEKVREHLSSTEHKIIRSYVNDVAEWYMLAETGDKTEKSIIGLDPFIVHLIRDRIESRFKQIYTEPPTGPRFNIVKGTRDQPSHFQDETFVLSSGFTRLIKEIIAMKKPIVGHNMLTDLLFIYKMFIGPLPNDYEIFKSEISSLFPELYDTKHMSYYLKNVLDRSDIWSSNILDKLYIYFKNRKGLLDLVSMPIIEHKSMENVEICDHYHNSGFDSYCTGYVFLKMAHIFSMWDNEEKSFASTSKGNDPALYFDATKITKNKINVTVGNRSYISLDGPDPQKGKPFYILVESLAGEINIADLTESMKKVDWVDVKQMTKRQALLASRSQPVLKSIFRKLVRTKNFRVTKYKPQEPKAVAAFSNSIACVTIFSGIALISFLLYKNSTQRGIGLWNSSKDVGT